MKYLQRQLTAVEGNSCFILWHILDVCSLLWNCSLWYAISALRHDTQHLSEHVLSWYTAVHVCYFSLGVRMIINCHDIIISFTYCFSVFENMLTFPCFCGAVSLSSSLLLVFDGQCHTVRLQPVQSRAFKIRAINHRNLEFVTNVASYNLAIPYSKFSTVSKGGLE